MRKLVFVIHTSIDGFVGGESGEFDALTQSPENLDFVCSITDRADAVLAGRISFEMLHGYWPTVNLQPSASSSEIKYSNWYNDAEKIVLSKSLRNKEISYATIISENIDERIRNIKNKKGKDILMFGSPSVYRTLTELNLIDEYWLIVYPVILGKGIAVFSGDQRLKKLKFLRSVQFSKGEIAINYEVEH